MKRKPKQKPVNILWLHSHFLYWMGGTKFIHHVIEELQKSEQIGEISIVVEDAAELAHQKYEELGVELISLKSLTSTSPWYWLGLPLFLVWDVLQIRKLLKNRGWSTQNTVVVSSMFPMNVVAAGLSLPHVQNCYEPFAFFYDQQFIAQFDWAKRWFIQMLALLYSPLDKWGTRQADVVLTLNNTTQGTIKETYGVASHKTQAGVNSALFKPYVSQEVRQRHTGKKLVIHSTDYSPVKGTDRVLRAFALVARQMPEALLGITTTIDDPVRKKVYQDLAEELHIADQVVFLGFLPIEELPQYYSLATVMVQGAVSEKSGTTSMSLPVKEAMCCGTPAIRPDAGGEDVVDGKTGFLVDPRETELLAEKMQYLLAHPQQAKKMGHQARQDIIKKYTWANTASVFEEQISKLKK